VFAGYGPRFEMPDWQLKAEALVDKPPVAPAFEVTICDFKIAGREYDMATSKRSKPSGGAIVTVPPERIEQGILLIRGEKVLLDQDLASLYGVQTKRLVEAVTRNAERFPADFMFRLTREEFDNLRSQFATSRSGGWGGRRYPPYAFTEQGVAMLSSVLNSKRAIRVNIEIMRAFVRLRQMLASHAQLRHKLAAMERKYDAQFKVVFDAIRELMEPGEKPKKGRIGFHGT